VNDVHTRRELSAARGPALHPIVVPIAAALLERLYDIVKRTPRETESAATNP